MRIRLAALVLLALTTLACGGGDDDAKFAPGACPIPAICDIMQADCQTALLKLTACVRGDAAPDTPDVRVIKLDAFREELETMSADAEPNPAEDAALAALHLLPEGGSVKEAVVDAQADSVVAYYDDDTKRVTIINTQRLTTSDALSSMYELSHELTHYLQDQSLGISKVMERFGKSLDGLEAGRSLIEGEAVVTSTRALAAIAGRNVKDLVWSNFTQGLRESTLEDMRKSSAPLAVAVVGLPYVFGTPYIVKAWDLTNRGRVDALFDDAPTSAVDWLGGYGDDGPLPSLSEELDCGPPPAPDDFELVGLDSYGISGAAALLSAAGYTAELTLVRTLVADAIGIYRSGEGDDMKALAAWRLRFQTSASATAFVNALKSLELESRSFDNEVLIVASSDAGTQPFDDAALKACPKLEDVRGQVHSPDVMASSLRRPF
jgi:hypothetical protein